MKVRPMPTCDHSRVRTGVSGNGSIGFVTLFFLSSVGNEWERKREGEGSEPRNGVIRDRDLVVYGGQARRDWGGSAMCVKISLSPGQDGL